MTTVEINNQTVESFLNEQAIKYNTSTKDYLINLVMTEIEYVKVKKDMETLQSEIKQVNDGNLQLTKASTLINEL